MMKTLLTFLAATFALSGAALAQDWQVLTYNNLTTPSAAPPAMLQIWGDLIADNNRYFRDELKDPRFKTGNAPAEFLSHTFTDGQEQITVSLINIARRCDNGANSASSTDIHGICPLRVVVTGPSGSKTTRTTGCFLVVPPGDPSNLDPRKNATFAAYDPKQRTVTVRALRNGRPLNSCTATVKIG
jgi:hypothetical protein